MAVAQDAFFIPDDIATGLATGLYRRIGSVVRYAVGPNKGQIVKLLQPIDSETAEALQGVGAKMLQFVKQHKVIVFGTTVVVGAGVFVYKKFKSHEPKAVTEFRAALRVYIDAIRDGNMDIDKIKNLMEALEVLKKHKNYEKIEILISTEELEILVGHIYDYTIKLAKDNNVELTEDDLCAPNGKASGIISNLQIYLKTQERIFNVA